MGITLLVKIKMNIIFLIDLCRHSIPMDFARLDDYMHQFKGSSSRLITVYQLLLWMLISYFFFFFFDLNFVSCLDALLIYFLTA